jgi:hypothetical protein
LPHVIEVAQDNEHLLEPFRRVASHPGSGTAPAEVR